LISEHEKAWAWDLLVVLGEGDWDGLLGLALYVYIYIYICSFMINSIIHAVGRRGNRRSFGQCLGLRDFHWNHWGIQSELLRQVYSPCNPFIWEYISIRSQFFQISCSSYQDCISSSFRDVYIYIYAHNKLQFNAWCLIFSFRS